MIAVLAVLSLTARSLLPVVSRLVGARFLPILVMALVAALSALALLRSVTPGRADRDLPPLILAGAAVLFLLVGRPVIHLQVMAAGCFFLGAAVRMEGMRRRTLPGVALLMATALFLEGVLLLKAGGRFLPMNCGVHFLASMSGFCVAAPLKSGYR